MRARYLVPNAITAASMGFAALAMHAAVFGRPRTAAWWSLYCVLTDKLDGFVARRLRATSEFGVQMDSLADFFSFGIAPATVFYVFLSTHAELGWAIGWRRWLLGAVSVTYVVCAAVRLARFNVTVESPGASRMFFGTPTTFVGGFLCAAFATLLKYGAPAWTAGDEAHDWRLLGALRLDSLMRLFPLFVLVGAYGMVSTLRVPKLGMSKSRIVSAYVVVNVVLAYTVGFFRLFPEYLAIGALTYLAGSFWFHARSPEARGMTLPPLFPE